MYSALLYLALSWVIRHHVDQAAPSAAFEYNKVKQGSPTVEPELYLVGLLSLALNRAYTHRLRL